MAQLLLHLRDNMHHFPGMSSVKLLHFVLFVFWASLYLDACLDVISIIWHCCHDKFCVCRACVLYSDNIHNSAEVTDDLSKCCIKEVEKPQVDRSCGIPMTRLPIQVPQTIQGLDFSMIASNFAEFFKLFGRLVILNYSACY